MPRPVRELWKALGARSDDDGGDLLVVDAKVLGLESIFGGALVGEANVRLFSEEAFGFSAPEELAALGVFWAPHLEKDEQLRAAVKDAQDRLQRRLEEEGRLLARLGFRAALEPPSARSRGQVDVDGHRLDVVIGGGGELLLERVDGAAVPPDAQEIVHVVEAAKRDEVQREIGARARALIAAGRVQPAELSMEEILDDGAGFDDDSATRQLSAAAAEDLDPGTELVPPSGEDDADGGLDELARALAAEELADDSEEDAAAGFDDDLDEELEGGDKAPAARSAARARAQAEHADDEEFVPPTTSPSVASQTLAPGSFVDFPAMATEQMSVMPPPPSEDSAGGFDEDTGEQGLLGSLSGEDGVMPSPSEATALRPAPTASQLGLSDDDDAPIASAPPAAHVGDEEEEERTMTVAAVARSDGEDVGDSLPGDDNDGGDADEEEEHTVSRAQQLRTGRKGPSLVSSGSVGSSVDEPQERDDARAAPAEAAEDPRKPALADSFEQANTLRPGQLSHAAVAAAAGLPPLSDDDEYERTEHESHSRRDSSPGAPSADSFAHLDATDPVVAVIARPAPGSANDGDEGAGPSLEVDIEVAVPSAEPGEWPVETAEIRRGSAMATARAQPVKEAREEPTAAEPPLVVQSEERLDALAAIVGEGMSSGKTGAIMLDADAFAHLRALTGHDLPLSEDPDALEREAELLESKARELRGRAEMLRQRPTVPVSARKLASRLERERASRNDDDASALEGAAASSDASAFENSGAFSSQDAFTARDPVRPFGEDEDAADKDAFADGVALEEVRAMLAAERLQPAPEGYAATQLAEMDLGDLRQPSHSGGVFGDGEEEEPPYEMPDNTSRANAYQTSMGSLPQVASSDVHALGSLAEPSAEGGRDPALAEGDDDDGIDTLSLAAAELRAVSATGARALALVVNDPRARERLKKHLEETFPRVVELASAREAASLSVREVQAVVIVRPIHDEATVSGLAALGGNGGRPPVLVLSSDASFDGLPGVDLRLELGRRASEVARQVLEGLTTLGVPA